MELERQTELAQSAKTWFDQNLKSIIADNRRRYDMKLKDEKERKALDLSCLPSTKSTAAVDKYVESSIITYHSDPDALSYTAKSTGIPEAELAANWLTHVFRYRCENSFPFFTWHQASLTAGGVDGLECALVRWNRESYTEKKTKLFAISDDGSREEVKKEVFDQYSTIFPEKFVSEEADEEVICTDSFWYDQLEPGVDVLWDPNAPLLDVNQGQFVVVKSMKTVPEVLALVELGIIDPISEEDLTAYQKTGQSGTTFDTSSTSTGLNPDSHRFDKADLGDKNEVELWTFFDRENFQWGVQFSIEGKLKLSERKPLNEVWYGGRRVNRVPVVVGTTKLKLWKSAGRAIPETIAPLEDQHIDHINNVNDAAKIAVQGRYRVNPDTNMNFDDLLNRRIVKAEAGEYDRIETDFGILTAMRVDDSITGSINELIPAGLAMAGRGVVPKGTDKTLGAIQIGKMEGDEKQGVHIKTRNETFLKPLMWLTAQLIFAFETDEQVLRKAAANAGIEPPEVTLPDGRRIIDVTALDHGVDVQINAGLGSAPRYQKAQMLQQVAGWRRENAVPTDFLDIARQLNVLAGFTAEQFLPKQEPPPPPPKTEYKATLNVDLAQLLALKPEAGNFLMQKLISGEMNVDAKISGKEQAMQNEAMQNGGGMHVPNRTGQVVDGTGDAAMGMSMGGQQNAGNP